MVNRNHNLKQYPEKKSIPYSHLHSLWLETGNSVGNAITLSGNLKGKLLQMIEWQMKVEKEGDIDT